MKLYSKQTKEITTIQKKLLNFKTSSLIIAGERGLLNPLKELKKNLQRKLMESMFALILVTMRLLDITN